MAKPVVLDQEWLDRIALQVNGLEYGSVLITVHDGRVVQIDRTERSRFDGANAKRQSRVASGQDAPVRPEDSRSGQQDDLASGQDAQVRPEDNRSGQQDDSRGYGRTTASS